MQTRETWELAKKAISIWHPVGPHAGESLDRIVERKKQDIDTHGRTFWAFAHARGERVAAWREQLRGQRSCVVFCCGEAGKDPLPQGGRPHWTSEYSKDLAQWRALPSRRMVSYHRGPRKNGIVASAFVVERIVVPEARVERPRRWFLAQEGRWQNAMLPTRGEYLVESPRPSSEGKAVRVLLYLAEPFIVWVR